MACFTPEETAYGTHWVDPRAGLDSAREKTAGIEPHLLRRKCSHNGAKMVDGTRLSAQVTYVSGLLTYIHTRCDQKNYGECCCRVRSAIREAARRTLVTVCDKCQLVPGGLSVHSLSEK